MLADQWKRHACVCYLHVNVMQLALDQGTNLLMLMTRNPLYGGSMYTRSRHAPGACVDITMGRISIVIIPFSCIPENTNASVSLDVRLLSDRTVPGPRFCAEILLLCRQHSRSLAQVRKASANRLEVWKQYHSSLGCQQVTKRTFRDP